MRILFVCLGNICRSPAAEGVFRHQVEQAQLSKRVAIDSAGIGGWHVGAKADDRMRAAATRRGYELTSRARQLADHDFEHFDRIVAMDHDNLSALRARCPDELRHKLELMRDHDAIGTGGDVPDPYYGGDGGFEQVLDILERSCRTLLGAIERDLG